MKKFLATLILILMFQTPSQTDDIDEFQIEGISVGDSLLKHFSKSLIKEYTVDDPGYKKILKDKFLTAYFTNLPQIKIYDGIQITFKTKDKKFIIESVEGILKYQDINKCYKKMNEIDSEISNMFTKFERDDKGIESHPGDPKGKSTTHIISYTMPTGTLYGIACDEWADHMPKHYFNNLKVVARSKFLDDFLINEGFK